MRQMRRKVDRILAMLLSILMVAAMLPVHAVYAAGTTKSTLSTNLSDIEFVVGEAQEFTVTSTANDDAGAMVKGSFVFSEPAAIEKLEYYETAEGMQGWYELKGDFGPASGFPLMDATSRFRVTVNAAGTYTADITLKDVNTGEAYCSATANITVKVKPGTITSDIAAKKFVVYQPTEFSFTSEANADAGKMVKGSFVFSDMQAIEKLEYYETAEGMQGWYELTGDFGPTSGFPMMNATSRFRVTFNKAGDYSFTVSMKEVATGDVVCKTDANITVEKAKITGISISPVTEQYDNGKEFALVVLNGTLEPNDKVTYSIEGDPDTYASIPMKSAVGEYSVTITVDRGENYEIFTQTVTSQIEPGNIVLGDIKVSGLNGVYTGKPQNAVTVTGAGTDYTLTYQLDGGEWMDTIPTVTNAGSYIVKVKATRVNYNDTEVPVAKPDTVEIPFNVYIAQAEQTGFGFANTRPDALAYNSTATYTATGGQTDQEVKYEVVSGGEYVSVDSKTGEIKAIRAGGKAMIQATRPGNENYKPVSATYEIQTIKANQTGFAFEQPDYAVQYGTRTLTVKASGGQSGGQVTYSVTEGAVGTVASQNNEGIVSFVSGQKGSMTIQASLSGGENYNDSTAAVTVTVNTNDFSSKYTITSVPETGWYTDTVTITPAEGYKVAVQLADAEQFTAEWKDSVVIAEEGQTSLGSIYLMETATGYISEKIDMPDIFVDKTVPTALEISYSTSVIDKILQGITFGFYKADVTVTLKATDNVSGIDHLVYTILDGKGNGTPVTIDKDKLQFSGEGKTAEASFKISPDLSRSKIKLEAFDAAGWSNELEGDKTLVADKTPPTIAVSYDNDTAANGHYFKDTRTATIAIHEENFFPEAIYNQVTHYDENGAPIQEDYKYLTIKVGKRLQNEDNYTYVYEEPEFTYDTEDGCYKAQVKFTENADYTLDIKFYDFSLNENEPIDYGDSVAPVAFTVDREPPKASMQIGAVSIAETEETYNNYSKFYKEQVQVILSADCGVSGTKALQYQKHDGFVAFDRLDASNWIDYDAETGVVVYPGEKFVLYFHAEDMAGNVAVIRSTGIIVDSNDPVGKENASNIDIIPDEANGNGLHNKNVNVAVQVIDPKYNGTELAENGVCSGLKSITYKIAAAGIGATETGTLYDASGSTNGKTETDPVTGLVTGWSGNITINANTFNSNDVKVTITATDNAGNEKTTVSDPIAIDVSAPRVHVSYDENDVDSGTFFKTVREATIEIYERNFTEDTIASCVEIKTTSTGAAPVISGWTMTAGSQGNMDDTKWTATIVYPADGDYTFGISCTDLAENPNNGVTYDENTKSPEAFTIDTKVPTVKVTYDNNSALNDNYYKADRTATITIVEHNFDVSRVSIDLGATDDGSEIAKPVVSKWSTDAATDTHTATVTYNRDGRYTFDISVTDKAGNVSTDFAQQVFYVDKTAPTLDILGVADQSANSGDIIPAVSYTDTNYDDAQVSITLTGAMRGNVALDGAYADQHNGKVFTFKNFAREKSVDDIYTLTATLTDKAGNTTEKTIVFSANRFGSTYAMSEATEKLNGTYVQKEQDVVVTETNPNALSNIKLVLFKNNETLELKEGIDYTMQVSGSAGRWHVYTYTILAKNFVDDGVYRLSFYSEDAAGNVAENTLDTKNMELAFGIDKTKPVVVPIDLESGIQYAVDMKTVSVEIKDNLVLEGVKIYLNGQEIQYTVNGETYTFDIPKSNSKQDVRIVAVDAAGNEEPIEITGFLVNANIFVRWFNNTPLFIGSIAGVVVLAGAVVFLVTSKKKKEETDAVKQ